jgi:hypoxanthine phosphoribosyltransferase
VPVTEPAAEREVLTYDDFGVAVRELGQTIADDGFAPDLVLAVARGGLGVAMGLAYALGVKDLLMVNVELYTGVGTRLDAPVLLSPAPSLDDLAGKRVLVADDVADSGLTLRLVHEWCATHVAEFRTAVLYRKPPSVIEPDYVWRRTDRWINFPWSWQGPVTPSAMMAP